MFKILLDAGHYGKYNPYSTIKPKEWSEAEMAWALQGYLKAELEAYGIEVGVTRSNPAADLPVAERGAMAEGYDLLLSLHSNACNTETVDRAVMCCYQSLSHTEIDDISLDVGGVLGRTVKDVMGLTSYQIYQRRASTDRDGDGIKNDEYYGILNAARQKGVPAVIVEHSFHTNKRAALWLANTENLRELAKAEAAAIAGFYSLRVLGDVNGDGKSNSLDAAQVLKYDAGMISLSEKQKERADVNGDGEVNSLDAAKILREDAGI